VACWRHHELRLRVASALILLKRVRTRRRWLEEGVDGAHGRRTRAAEKAGGGFESLWWWLVQHGVRDYYSYLSMETRDDDMKHDHIIYSVCISRSLSVRFTPLPPPLVSWQLALATPTLLLIPSALLCSLHSNHVATAQTKKFRGVVGQFGLDILWTRFVPSEAYLARVMWGKAREIHQ
jgi:hypothetical protein